MPCPSVAALGLSGGLLALLLRRPLVGRGAGPRAGLVRLALAAVFTFCLAQMR